MSLSKLTLELALKVRALYYTVTVGRPDDKQNRCRTGEECECEVKWMNLTHNTQKKGKCVRICEESHYNSEIVHSLMLIICYLFQVGRVGTYRQVLHLFIKTISVCKILDKVYCN